MALLQYMDLTPAVELGGLAIAPDGDMLVADKASRKLLKLSFGGNPIKPATPLPEPGRCVFSILHSVS